LVTSKGCSELKTPGRSSVACKEWLYIEAALWAKAAGRLNYTLGRLSSVNEGSINKKIFWMIVVGQFITQRHKFRGNLPTKCSLSNFPEKVIDNA